MDVFEVDSAHTNEDRANWAQTAITAYQKRVGTDDESVLGDLLTDLHHWADQNGHDWESALASHDLHYTAETDVNVIPGTVIHGELG